ncbi:MAG: PD40 domain-containing protein [Thermoplasmata archaeon]|nr:PD40 domain-containing protein [Thermoplasmata archaeon]
MRRKTLVMVCLLVIALMLVSTVPAGAKKPPKDPPGGGTGPTGTIFYMQNEDVGGASIWSMDADGTDKTEVTDVVSGVEGMMSISLEKHKDGHRWFVYFVRTTGTHPDGKAQTELWAIRDDGTGAKKLWSDPSMVYMTWCGPIVWVSGDAFVSWASWKVAAGGTVSDAGIYKASISFGTTGDGAPSIGTPSLAWSTGTYHFNSPDEYRTAGRYPHWSTDGEKVVFADLNVGRTVVDFSGESPVKTVLGGTGSARWAPDGTKLAYIKNKALHTMDPDGTDDATLFTLRSNKATIKSMDKPLWSPDSKFLAYTEESLKKATLGISADVYIIGVDGKGNNCVANDVSTADWQSALAWR